MFDRLTLISSKTQTINPKSYFSTLFRPELAGKKYICNVFRPARIRPGQTGNSFKNEFDYGKSNRSRL